MCHIFDKICSLGLGRSTYSTASMNNSFSSYLKLKHVNRCWMTVLCKSLKLPFKQKTFIYFLYHRSQISFFKPFKWSFKDFLLLWPLFPLIFSPVLAFDHDSTFCDVFLKKTEEPGHFENRRSVKPKQCSADEWHLKVTSLEIRPIFEKPWHKTWEKTHPSFDHLLYNKFWEYF